MEKARYSDAMRVQCKTARHGLVASRQTRIINPGKAVAEYMSAVRSRMEAWLNGFVHPTLDEYPAIMKKVQMEGKQKCPPLERVAKRPRPVPERLGTPASTHVDTCNGNTLCNRTVLALSAVTTASQTATEDMDAAEEATTRIPDASTKRSVAQLTDWVLYPM